MQRHPWEVERTVHFFHANIGYQEDGLPFTFDPVPALESIASLLRDRAPHWYEEEPDGNALCLFPELATYRYPVARFGRVRRQALPQIEEVGDITDLQLRDKQGLLELIHVVFFPDNIVGAEYNHHGPRATRLGPHLETVSQSPSPKARLNPVIREDALRQLDDIGSVHLLDLEVLPSMVEIIENRHAPTGRALRALADVSNGSRSLQLIIRPEPEDERDFWTRFGAPLRELFIDPEVRPGIKRGRLQGRPSNGGSLEMIDLLQDQITSVRTMVRLATRSRALDPDYAFRAVVDAYHELRDEIVQSPTIAARRQDGR
jgi:hypothetical protein